ncbi:hypothetical protein CGC44_07805 [Francisella opportunistica]|uniref:Uncharacterized protein n=1 Tax=Francisella opportunistica TaxID=2016517 RepID=A0A345JTT6_9GAMM|nr:MULTISPECIES: hypothetical protein [Francisella]AXH30732.1 hypothetical protein CGC43_07830 [Francisella opportunistica]AXH32378.1 hypothetical protein CGC44_07805 [Francisella opportunistica]
MCEINFMPLLADDLLRLFISFILFLCCVILSYIFTKKKPWDIAFWICFSIFLFSMSGYGYIIHHIYQENTFSYDGFISGAAFITVCGLLFSRRRYIGFADTFVNKNTAILFATFFVFAFIYILTIKYNLSCVKEPHQFFIDTLQILIYPLLLLFAISAFLYRFSICLSAFAVSMALFIIENILLIAHSLATQHQYEVIFEEILFAIISIVLSTIAVYMLTRAKRIYKENKDV